MTESEARTVVRIAREPLWRGIVVLVVGRCVLALVGPVVPVCEGIGLSVVHEMELAASLQPYDWRGAATIAVVVAASWLGSWIALHSTNAEFLSRANSKGIGM